MSATIDSQEADLWVAVIAQAVYDATLGTGLYRGYGKRPRRVDKSGAGGGLSSLHVEQARSFLSCSTGALRDICDAMGMDYEETKAQLHKVYRDSLPKMPEEWRQELPA